MSSEVKAPGTTNTYRADQQKAGDRPGAATSSIAKRDFGDDSSDMADTVARKAKEAGETLKDKASDVGHSMQETGQNIAEKSKEAHKAVCSFTKDNPTAAVLIAFGVGAILARVLPGR